MDVRAYEEQQETIAFLKVAAMGAREIDDGKFRSAKEVFADLDTEDSQFGRKMWLVADIRSRHGTGFNRIHVFAQHGHTTGGANPPSS